MTKPEKSGTDANAPVRTTERRRRGLFRPTRRRPQIVTEFQSDAIEVEHRAPPRIARVTLYCVLALILTAIGWAAGSQVDMIVTAQGKLVTTRPNIVVQPLETSVIREIHVKPGDRVNRGELLATLDPTFSQADLDQLSSKVGVFNAAIDRLKAELNGEEYVIGESASADQVLQRKMFLQRKAAYDAQVENYQAQIASARANLKTAQNEETVLLQRLETMKSIEVMRATLMDKEVGSKLNLLLSRDARLDVESDLARVRGNIADYTHRLDKAEADQKVYAEDFRKTAYQDLVETLAKRDSAAEDLKKAELRRQLIVLKAPADAIVLDIANRTVGSVAREAEPMFVLVPAMCRCGPRSMSRARTSARFRSASLSASSLMPFRSRNTGQPKARSPSSARTRSRRIRKPKVRTVRPLPITAYWSTCPIRTFGCRRSELNLSPAWR